MFQTKHSQLPLSCMNDVTMTSIDRIHNTRLIYFFNVPHDRTVIRQNSINICGLKLWESLPTEVQNPSSISVFKKKLLKYILTHITHYDIFL